MKKTDQRIFSLRKYLKIPIVRTTDYTHPSLSVPLRFTPSFGEQADFYDYADYRLLKSPPCNIFTTSSKKRIREIMVRYFQPQGSVDRILKCRAVVSTPGVEKWRVEGGGLQISPNQVGKRNNVSETEI
ncbi:hypothetical protein KKF38_00055 [Patescibacteria group bacterium]|nr:hypothetical protein [Patescibacteria group bacterium]